MPSARFLVRCLASSEKCADNNGVVITLFGHNLAETVGGDATNVVVHNGPDRDRLLGHTHAGEDGSCLRDAGKTLVEHIRGKVVKVKVDPFTIRPAARALADLESHKAGLSSINTQILDM